MILGGMGGLPNDDFDDFGGRGVCLLSKQMMTSFLNSPLNVSANLPLSFTDIVSFLRDCHLLAKVPI